MKTIRSPLETLWICVLKNCLYLCSVILNRKMKYICTKILRALSLLTGFLTVTSCMDEIRVDAPGVEPSGKVKVGFFAGGTQTRTAMLPDGLSAEWVSGDEIAVWAMNSSGSYVLTNQTFGTYGIDASRGFFSSTLDAAMPEDTYTYYCCYPAPVSVSGMNATFNVPSVQDGKASGGADVMVATPVQHSAMTAIPDPEDHSGLSMSMNRMMHQFRFYVPEDDQLLGDEKIERVLLNFPVGVTGNVTVDLSDPSVPAVVADAQTDAELNLSQPIGVSTGEDYQFACFSFAPVQFAEGHTLQILKAYTDDKIAYLDPIALNGKTCLAGHSTPVKLKIREIVDYAGIIYLNLGTNNLGENPKKITFTAPEGCNWGDGGTNVFVYDPGREIPVGETVAIKFETDVDAYMAFSGKEVTITYDSENALMSETLVMPAITGQGSTKVSLTVPYLLFEDFSCVYAEGESYGNNSYSQSEREQPGSSLDGCMSHTGWNAARYWTTGNSMRINTRYQCVKILITFASSHHGRLDTPQLTGLKDGKTVSLKMSFDAGGYLHESSSATVSNVNLCVATHTNAGVLDGIPTGSTGISSSYDTSLTDFGTRQDSHAISSDFGNNAFNDTFPTYESELLNVTSSTRIVFYVIFSGSESMACNAEFNVYLDNIKVQIAK